MALLKAWPAPALNNPVLSEIVPASQRSIVFACDRLFEGEAPPCQGVGHCMVHIWHGSHTVRTLKHSAPPTVQALWLHALRHWWASWRMQRGSQAAPQVEAAAFDDATACRLHRDPVGGLAGKGSRTGVLLQ